MSSSAFSTQVLREILEKKFPGKVGLDPGEIAETTGISKNQIYNELKSGKLRSVRSGKRWIVPVSALLEYLGVADKTPHGAA